MNPSIKHLFRNNLFVASKLSHSTDEQYNKEIEDIFTDSNTYLSTDKNIIVGK